MKVDTGKKKSCMSALKRSCAKRINYKVLNSTGEKVLKDCAMEDKEEKEVNQDKLESSNQIKDTYNEVQNSKEDINSISSKSQNPQLITRYCVLKDEINDFIDENPINQSSINVLDIDNCISKISILRTEFRTICKEVTEKTADNPCKDSESTLALIKEYIINANERRSSVRRLELFVSDEEKTQKLKRESEESTQKQRAANFP